MKTLKAKLFFSVGAILFFVGVLNIVLSELWIKRGLAQKGSLIKEHVKEAEERVEKFSSFLITLKMIEEAAGLERIIYQTASFPQGENTTLWRQAEAIASYDPQIAFVEVEKEGKTAAIAPLDARLYPFSYSRVEDGFLWVKVEGKEGLFVAIPEEGKEEGNYLLFSEEGIKKVAGELDLDSSQLKKKASTPFQKVEMEKSSFGIQDSVPELFHALLTNENEWLYKMDLIQSLLEWMEKDTVAPVGAIKIVGKSGGCLFQEQVLSTSTYVKASADPFAKDELFLLQREVRGETDVDVVKGFCREGGEKVILGFSVCQVLKEISALSGKMILVEGKGISLGIKPDGTLFSIKEGTSYHKEYVSFDVNFSLFSVAVLTPKTEAMAISSFLDELGQEMLINVSLSLLGASFISFVIALLLLRNISTKITKPIAVLSEAAEHLGSGDYEKIALPEISHRHDEVAKLTNSFAGMVGALQDRDKIRGVLHKVVSKEISEKILKGNLDFTGEERVLTLLFSDIRNFTKMSEGLTPAELISMLNLYMTRMCHIIDETHGVVDKFVGDEIMTLYGAPVELEFHAALAVEAALRMMEDLRGWNEERKKDNLIVFEVGIGIHTGLVYTGNMGAENRLNYTAIGANVNLASRVCSIAEPMQVLITEETYNSPGVKDKFRVNPLGEVSLKGIEHKVQVYEVTEAIK